MATYLNNFFTDIAENLVGRFPPVIGKYGYDFVKKYYQEKVSTIGVVPELNPLRPLRDLQYGLGETVFGGCRPKGVNHGEMAVMYSPHVLTWGGG